MKKLMFMLFIGWMSVAAGYAQLPVKFYDENCAVSKSIFETLEFQNDSVRTQLSAGFYGGDQTINLGSSATLEFRFEGTGPVDFSYSDGQYVFIEEGVQTSPYYFEVRPMTQTTYQLRKVRNASGYGYIQEGHESITVFVGNGNNVVQTNFLPPSNLCENASPIDLRNYFSSNVSGTVWFRGDGIEGNVFYPQSAGVGSHYIESFLSYNGTTYSVGSNISVDAMPQVTLWLPNEVLQNSDPFVLSGGRPSGGIYFVDGIVCDNTFDPSKFSVGWHIVTYTYTAPSGCQDTAETKIYIRSSGFGLDEDEEDSEFSLYPNPTDGTVHFKVPCSVEVISQYRVSMYRSNSLQESVDLSAFPAGIYTLRLFDGEKITIRKVVKI